MKRIGLIALAAVLAMATAASAAKKKAAPPPEEPAFKTQLNASLTLTDGNSDTLGANASLVTEGEKEGLGSVIAGIEGNYAETGTTTVDAEGNTHDDTEKTIENARAYADVKKTLTELTYVSLNLSGEYDDIAAVDYRFMAGPAYGVYFIKSDKQSLCADLGLSYVWEKLDGAEDDYLAFRLAERYSLQLTENSTLAQTLEYVPKADELDRYLLNAEVALDVAMNDRLSLRFVVQDSYNSDPASGMDENDLTVMAGFGYKF